MRALAGGRAAFHLYLSRTPGYSSGLVTRLAKVADIQRADMGIAMAHFAAAAGALGLSGSWSRADPGLPVPDGHTEYAATWS